MQLSVILLFLQLWGNVEVSLSQNVCSKLPDVPHALVSEETKKTEYQEADVIHFTCEPGYISGQTSKYVCASEGWLTVHQGTCYSCSTLPDVPHAHVSEETKKAEYQEADVIHFTCEPRYISGPTIKYVCTSKGWLAVRQGTCYFSASNCDPPPADGGLIVKGLPENEEPILPDQFLTFSCDGPGKYLNGNSVLICGKDGQWDNPFPSCEEKCNVTGVPANVRITTYVPNNQLRKGQNLRFACHKRGDTLRGRASVECLANGQWSDPFPTCGAPLGCGKPPVLANGDTKESVRFRYLHNERVEYICQRWHVMEGEPYKTCNNGEWIGQMKCLKPCTVNRETMKKHNITFRYTRYDKLYSEHSDEIEFVCIRGTRHDGSVNMRQRCVDGVVLLPTCQDEVFSIAEIKCTVPMIQNGYVPGDIQEYKEHEVLHFECNPQYKRAEDRPSICTKLGIRADWTPTPVCEQIKCRLPPTLEGTRYEPAFRNVFSPGDTLRVICGEKYWISNHQTKSALATCKDDGQWTVRPVCQEVICRIPEDPLVVYWYNNWRQQIKLDETVSYQCRSGYKRTDGVTRATCTRDGWRPNPLCEELVSCGAPPLLADGDLKYTMKSQYSHNESVEYMCQGYYTIEGQPYRICINGKWTGHIRCLKPCVVNEDNIRQHNIALKSSDNKYLVHDEIIEFRCARGIPVGAVAMRQRCNGGVILLPTCQ
ncbi:complement factor H-like [Siniperca chuatsi]|uniref:complement factor H-like n=1 Tax=Siniperca chuatsi TaxID=119488 RepID=UPI001CE10A57|nr:complement factor H-like [Siniperca chuatsi]